MSLRRLERIIERAEDASRRYERPLLLQIQQRLREIERGIVNTLTPLYTYELDQALDRSRAYREGRAKVILAQVSEYLNTLENVQLGINSTALTTAYASSYETGIELMSVYENVTPFFTPRVNVDAITSQIRDGQKRLFRHSKEAVKKINDAVTEGLALGRSARHVARDIRAHTDYTAFRAQTIALTEMSSSRVSANKNFYKDQAIDLVQYFATIDDRVCQHCGPKHGNVYKRSEIKVPQHPRCRCWLLPFRESYLEADLIDIDGYKVQQREIKNSLEARGLKPSSKKAPFERSAPTPIWTPGDGFLR